MGCLTDQEIEVRFTREMPRETPFPFALIQPRLGSVAGSTSYFVVLVVLESWAQTGVCSHASILLSVRIQPQAEGSNRCSRVNG